MAFPASLTWGRATTLGELAPSCCVQATHKWRSSPFSRHTQAFPQNPKHSIAPLGSGERWSRLGTFLCQQLSRQIGGAATPCSNQRPRIRSDRKNDARRSFHRSQSTQFDTSGSPRSHGSFLAKAWQWLRTELRGCPMSSNWLTPEICWTISTRSVERPRRGIETRGLTKADSSDAKGTLR